MTADRPSRRRRAPGARLARTIVLAAAALAAVLYWLQQYLELDPQELLGYAGLSLLWVCLPFGAALATVWLWILLRRALSRQRER